MKVLYKSGMNVSEIGRHLGIHRTSVMYWLGRIKKKKPLL